ncbi:MAG: SDH family Clp fold serine proteinase [Candidatus Humimicrobiaceae bacterium]
MSLLNEYINKNLSAFDLENELIRLLKEYNKASDTYSLLFYTDATKQIPEAAINYDDYFIIHDLLKNCKNKNLDFFLETLGGSGETVLEIVNFLREKFDIVRFIISGQAKSAGTMLTLSGDDILMTETGSLGPIDAQVRIGRFVNSADDYMQWVNEKQEIAKNQGKLNPFDATMVAQVSPGELKGVSDALMFAIEMVEKWLAKYKFKNWTVTESRKIPVTQKMKDEQARRIAIAFTDKTKWRTHARPIKVNDLNNDIGIKVIRVEDDPKISDLVYRIQVVSKLYFTSTSAFKIYATEDNKIFRNATQRTVSTQIPQIKEPDVIEINVDCKKCSTKYRIYAKLKNDPKIDADFISKGFIGFPKDNKLICNCGAMIDLTGIRNDLESKFKKKIII